MKKEYIEFAKKQVTLKGRKKLKETDITSKCKTNCPICDIKLEYTKYHKPNCAVIDNIKPIQYNGDYMSDNIDIICERCKGIKGSNVLTGKNGLYNIISRRKMLCWLQDIPYPKRLQTLIKIAEYIKNHTNEFMSFYYIKDRNVIDMFPNINHLDIIDNVWCIRIRDGKIYNTGDTIKITTHRNNIIEKTVTIVKDDITIPLRYNEEILDKCKDCGNILYFISKKREDIKFAEFERTATCCVCRKTQNYTVLLSAKR